MQHETIYKVGFMAVSSTVLLAVATGCVLWLLWFAGRRKWNLCGDRSPELITRLPQRTPRWTVFDFLVMFGTMLFAGSFLLQLAPRTAVPDKEIATVESVPVSQSTSELLVPDEPGVEDESLTADDSAVSDQATKIEPVDEPVQKVVSIRDRIRIHFYANVASLFVILIYLRSVRGAALSDLSLIPSRSDVRRGLVATVWILAPVLIINLLIAMLVQYSHAVIDLLSEHHELSTFAFLLFSAAFVTPIVEEFQFRLLLQGGLQRLADAPPATPPDTSWNPSSAWPVLVTSLIFALMHFGDGAAPIPLFFLSVGLGFLYQRTGRLVPCIVVHLLLNAATLCLEFCRINAGISS